jgi:hypothetical protein
MPADDVELVTIPQAMDALGCSRGKIYSLSREGRLELVKFDKATRVTARSLQQLLRDIQRTPLRPGETKGAA